MTPLSQNTGMDTQVLAAMAKWPDVPAVFGWLSLTARGEWRLRGEPIENAAIRAFIGRNYAVDAHGRWYFQNGPQRVYVALAVTPWIYRVDPLGAVTTHTSRAVARCEGAAALDDGRLLLVTELGPGLVDDRDTAVMLRAITDPTGLVLNEQGLERWMDGKDEVFVNPALLHLAGRLTRIERLRTSELARRFGFLREPLAE
jgi:hypothetical protein